MRVTCALRPGGWWCYVAYQLLPLAIEPHAEATSAVEADHAPRSVADLLTSIVKDAVAGAQLTRLRLLGAHVELDQLKLLLGRERVEASHLRTRRPGEHWARAPSGACERVARACSSKLA